MSESERAILERIKKNSLAARQAAQEIGKQIQEAKEKEEQETTDKTVKPIPLVLNNPNP